MKPQKPLKPPETSETSLKPHETSETFIEKADAFTETSGSKNKAVGLLLLPGGFLKVVELP
jgi:hypothetical protein